MLNIFRWFPHLNYRNYGGKNRHRFPLKPADWMDEAFKSHDLCLMKAKNQKECSACDNKAATTLKEGGTKGLNWYGRLYRFFVIKLFS